MTSALATVWRRDLMQSSQLRMWLRDRWVRAVYEAMTLLNSPRRLGFDTAGFE